MYIKTRNKSTNNKSTITKNVDEKAKICPDGLYTSLVSRKNIINRFPNMKSIIYTKKRNKSTNNKSTITKNVDEKAKICPDGLYSLLVSR